MKKQEGNLLIIGLIFIAIAIVIFLFVIAIFLGHVNSILYNIKLDMYSMNRSAIIAVNKNRANIDYFSYDKKSYQEEFLKLLKDTYKLDSNLKNETKLISSFEVIEYEIYEKNQKDSYTKSKVNDRVIHTVLKVRIKPIILKSILNDLFTFDIHEDVSLNFMKTS